MNYFSLPTCKILKQMNIATFFPTRLLERHFLDYEGAIPKIENFLEEQTPIEEKMAIWDFHGKFQQGHVWRCREQLEIFLNTGLRGMIRLAFDLLRDQARLQKELCQVYQIPPLKCFFHPFSTPNITRAGYNHRLYKLFHSLNPRASSSKIYPISRNGVGGKVNTSHLEQRAIQFLLKNMGSHVNEGVYHFWSPYGPFTFGRLTPDLLIKAKPQNRAFFIHGCFMKGHERENCKIFPKDLCQLEKKIFGLDYAERRASCQAKMNLVPFDIEVTELWECELKFNQSYQHFVQYEFKEKPLTRLRPEDALSGGINEVKAMGIFERPDYHLTYFFLLLLDYTTSLDCEKETR
ncbi:uncharacterized protein LOC131891934 [Tigriopus californicus]|uniref:uncharacterized protein LOC131891934 n=1 Tax=Tigriopus californicus TaxID=6832 RepID=UPI0027DA8DD6|nr:uncharacterized protein LOC131891934 [Tigriopus californicus]